MRTAIFTNAGRAPVEFKKPIRVFNLTIINNLTVPSQYIIDLVMQPIGYIENGNPVTKTTIEFELDPAVRFYTIPLGGLIVGGYFNPVGNAPCELIWDCEQIEV